MRMKRITCLLVAFGAVVLVTALTGGQIQSAAPDGFRFEAAKLKDKTLWTQVNTEPYYTSATLNALCRAPTPANYEAERRINPHAATFITVYVNRVGRKAMFAKESQRFPEGSVIVKEKIGISSEGRTPLLYTIMVKRQRGYNPAVGDWEFSVASGDGKQIEASGKLENCQACHITRTNSDFVFRPYLALR